MQNELAFVALSENFSVAINTTHRFSTDSILLSAFCAPKRLETVCDLCSGSGVVSLNWFRGLSSAPKYVVGVEIQKDAHELMQLSIEKNNLSKRVVAVHKDLKEIGAAPIEGLLLHSFHIVSCNPPYQTEGSGLVAEKQRGMARHELACTIDDVCKAAAKLLRFKGKLCLCHKPSRLVDVLLAMRAANIEPKRLQMVQRGAFTEPWLFLVEGKLGAKPGLEIEAPLIMYDANNNMTSEALNLYTELL